MTQRYMHLSPAALDVAIGRLEIKVVEIYWQRWARCKNDQWIRGDNWRWERSMTAARLAASTSFTSAMGPLVR